MVWLGWWDEGSRAAVLLLVVPDICPKLSQISCVISLCSEGRCTVVAGAFSGLKESLVSGQVFYEPPKSSMRIRKRCHHPIDLADSQEELTRHKSFHQTHRMDHRPGTQPHGWSLPEARGILGEPVALRRTLSKFPEHTAQRGYQLPSTLDLPPHQAAPELPRTSSTINVRKSLGLSDEHMVTTMPIIANTILTLLLTTKKSGDQGLTCVPVTLALDALHTAGPTRAGSSLLS